MAFLDTFNLTQHVIKPTHKSGHTLDLLITKQGSNFVKLKDVCVFPPCICDHSVSKCQLMITKPRFPSKNLVFRQWKRIHKDMSQQDLAG